MAIPYSSSSYEERSFHKDSLQETRLYPTSQVFMKQDSPTKIACKRYGYVIFLELLCSKSFPREQDPSLGVILWEAQLHHIPQALMKQNHVHGSSL